MWSQLGVGALCGLSVMSCLRASFCGRFALGGVLGMSVGTESPLPSPPILYLWAELISEQKLGAEFLLSSPQPVSLKSRPYIVVTIYLVSFDVVAYLYDCII
jgi:hypothetical protein